MTEERDVNPNRRGLLKCMAWAGTGIVWRVVGGVLRGFNLTNAANAAPADGFTFVQISDSHIGFNKEANPDPKATLQAALDRIAKLPKPPALVIHTGDVSQLSKAEEFDTAAEIMKAVKQETHYIPGEHDVIGDDGKQFFERFAKQATPARCYSFDHGGVHFVALTNVLTFEKSHAGGFGSDQLGMAGEGPEGPHREHPDRRLDPRPDVATVPAMGLGNRGRAAGAGLPQAVWLGDRAQWPHPPGRAKGRGQGDLPDRDVSVPGAKSRRRARPGTA